MGSDTNPHPLISSWKALLSLLTSINTYVDVDVWKTTLLKTSHFRFSAATNDLDVKILGSIDGGVTYPFEVEAEFAVVTATPVAKLVANSTTQYFTHVKVQVKPTVADTHGTLSTQVAGA